MTDAAPILTLSSLQAGYGGRLIVDGVDLVLREREIATVIGHNGAGKSTLLKGIFNMVPTKRGTVTLAGQDISRLPAHRMLTAGIAYVPQNHSIFPKLTIAENLAMGGYLVNDKALMKERLQAVEELFPFLTGRKGQLAGTLSTGMSDHDEGLTGYRFIFMQHANGGTGMDAEGRGGRLHLRPRAQRRRF